MKKFLYSACILFTITFLSCEEPAGESDLFPYELKLVVSGVLEANKPVSNFYIGRTLPVEVNNAVQYSALSDAAAGIRVDSIFYPLEFVSDGLYKNDTLIIRRGKTYSLIVQWGEEVAFAQTTIPDIGDVISSNLISINNDGVDSILIECTVKPRGKEVYGPSWAIRAPNGTISREADEYSRVYMKGIDGATQLNLKTLEIPPGTVSGDQSIYLHLHVYDEPFYKYFYSKGSNQVEGSVFGQSGANVVWNIKGNGVGMFIGKTDTLIAVE